MNGLSLARELRQTKKVPIVVLSALVELPGETIGAAEVWVTKGISSEELLTRLEELLEKGETRRHPQQGQHLRPQALASWSAACGYRVRKVGGKT